MAEIITMPKMSDTMTEGVVAEWLKKVGDVLKPGDGLLAEIETDKATMELDLDERMDLSNFKDCRLLYIGLEKGKAVPIDSIIAIIGENGEAYEHLLSGAPAAALLHLLLKLLRRLLLLQQLLRLIRQVSKQKSLVCQK
jgi:pyruvate dehydrogenase E2 component (dihydrolipoamide acetyltransferase)